jgi:hypothetical protein
MKRFFSFLALAFLSFSALAADVVASIEVKHNGKPVYATSNTFFGVTDAEAAALQKSGIKQLDFASKHQDKGGPYTIVWKWGSEPAIETAGLSFGNANAVMRQGVKWLDARVTAAETARKQGKAKPWGN